MKTGILLANLGTPDSPSVSDVRKYLREFLNDPRVIDISPVGRFFLVNFIIVPFRARRSAALYKRIWTDKGSPLLCYSIRQKELLQKKLGDSYVVELGMRYQKPSLTKALDNLRNAGVNRIIILPLFPQYASASTGSVHQRIMEHVKSWQVVPDMDFVNSYHDDEGFISSLAEVGRPFMSQSWDHVLMSFHGLPERQIRKAGYPDCLQSESCCSSVTEKNASCYRAQCFGTARALAKKLQLSPGQYTVCFQSRLGRTPWIKPYTDDLIRQRASKGDKRLLVFAPAFTSDCLETIEEIGSEYHVLFSSLGGEKVQLVPGLNDSPVWVDALKRIVEDRK